MDFEKLISEMFELLGKTGNEYLMTAADVYKEKENIKTDLSALMELYSRLNLPLDDLLDYFKMVRGGIELYMKAVIEKHEKKED